MPELLLLRHGKSDWSTQTDDFHRPITDKGKRMSQRIGVYLAQQHLEPDRVISSPAIRAKTTAEKTIKAMGSSSALITYDEKLYDAILEDFLVILQTIPKNTQRVMLVGHNPGLELLILYLSKQKIKIPSNNKLMLTASLAHLQFEGEWKSLTAQSAQLVKIQYAKNLPKRFPYPMPDGKEKRIRPAYYYTQSSVIPYRIKKNTLQILLILSSQKKHYVIPKGIKEPGLSARKSAAKEAFEEAGIEGKVAHKAIGSYRYEKWQAECKVIVYPMQVKKMLDEEQWQEQYRSRKWYKLDQAITLIYQDEIKKLLAQLPEFLQL